MTDATTPIVNTDSTAAHDMPHAIAAVLRNFKINDDQLVPARVLSYDRVNNLASIQPLILWVGMDGTKRAPPPIADVPVLSLGGGGFHISFPLIQGDIGWIFAADRDLDLFKASLDSTAPGTGRMHSFADSMFIPDVFRKYTIADEDSGAMVIQSTGSATRISIRGDNIKITAPAGVVIDTPETTVTGALVVNGPTTVNGGFDASSSSSNAPCILPASTTIGNVKVIGHGHEQNGTSGRTLGGMES
jgi:hypothetical protein